MSWCAMEMQDFLRYFAPMAALSVASFSGSHLLRDPAPLPQGTQLTHDNDAALLPTAHPRPPHPANLTATPTGTTTAITPPEIAPPEGARVDAETLWLASNEPYPIPDLPPLPSLSEIINQSPLPSPAPVSLDPALIHASVQALSDSPLEAMITAEVASKRVAAVTNPEVVPPETAPLRVHGEVLAASPTPRANPNHPGILVATLPHPEPGSALQLAPLQAVTAFREALADPSSTASRRDVSTATQHHSLEEIPHERPIEFTSIPAGIAPRIESAIDIPVPPPEPTLVTDASPIVAENRVSTSLAPSASPSPTGLIAQSLPPSHAPDYTLGPGDRLFVDIFNVPKYSKSYQVMVDGTLSLPRVGRIAVTGLTLDQASALIRDRYRQFFVEPLTTLVLEQARPVTVALSGEVNRPGSYQFKPTETGAFPTLTQAIQQAEGITQAADLRRVEIRRPQANGLEQVIEVNLWELVQSSHLAQDITLRDGDMIRIAPALALSPAQRSQLAEANFAPATIRVNVIGEVVRPGVVEITPNTPLNQAVLSAGGFVNGRANRQAVELIRLQPNGTVQRRTIAVDLAEGVNEATNPILQPNDVVLVARSNFAQTTDTISQITAPTLFLLNLLRLF